jgi:hypothetical protein
MTAEQNTPRPKETILHRSLGTLHSGPDVHTAARSGVPNMEAESEAEAGTDILKGGGRATLVGGPTAGSGATSSGVVATVKPGEAAPAGSATGAATSEDVNSTATPDSTTPAPEAGTTGTSAPESTSTPPAAASTAPDGSSTAATDAPKTDGTQATTPPADDKQKESSSKKKGLKKILPW